MTLAPRTLQIQVQGLRQWAARRLASRSSRAAQETGSTLRPGPSSRASTKRTRTRSPLLIPATGTRERARSASWRTSPRTRLVPAATTVSARASLTDRTRPLTASSPQSRFQPCLRAHVSAESAIRSSMGSNSGRLRASRSAAPNQVVQPHQEQQHREDQANHLAARISASPIDRALTGQAPQENQTAPNSTDRAEYPVTQCAPPPSRRPPNG